MAGQGRTLNERLQVRDEEMDGASPDSPEFKRAWADVCSQQRLARLNPNKKTGGVVKRFWRQLAVA
jgi:hypothetical protein